MATSFIKETINRNVGELSELQKETLSIMSNYIDLYYPDATYQKWDDITNVYSIHVVNHILKTRARIITNNYTLNEAKLQRTPIDPELFRDQGLARPKVLIILPSKHSAYR